MCTTTLLNAATATFRDGENGYTGTVDTFGSAAAPTVRSGSEVRVLVDNDNPIAHGLLRFENIFGSAPGQVPLNATITSASLTLRTFNDGDPVWFHRMLVRYEETNNWNEFATSGPGLQADDIEMLSTPEFTFTGANPTPRVDTFDVTAIVQGWFAGTFPNHGWGITNQISNGWQFDSAEATTVTNRPLLTIVFDAPCAPISIVTHPQSRTTNEGGSVTFSVIVTGSDPIYQWYKDNSPITDATGSTYTIPFVLRGDAGVYRVNVQNTCAPSNVDSQNATLTVINDEIPPRVICAYGSNDSLTVFVTFDEPVTNALAATSYAIVPVGAGDQLQVTNVAYTDATFTAVALTIEGSTPMAAGISYNLTVSGVDDRFNNTLVNSPVIPISRFPTAAHLAVDGMHLWKYSNPTSNVSLGTAWRASNYDDSGWSNGLALLGREDTPAALPEPLRTDFEPIYGYVAGAVRTFYFRTHFNFPDNAVGAVLCLRPVLDDAAAFHLNGAEIFRLRLPEVYDHNTEGLGGAVGNGAYEGPFYVCVTNLVQGDNVLAVEVHQTGATSSDIVMGVEVSALVPRLDPLVITQDPVGGSRNEGESITFSVGFTGTNPRFQWYKDNSPITDATNSTYTISFVRTTDAGQYHVVISNEIPSTDTSNPATLTVIQDSTPPSIVCAYFAGVSNDIFIVFSEIVTNGIDDPFGYTINGSSGGELFTAAQSYTDGTNSGRTVMLVLSESTPRVAGDSYTLTTAGIRDRFGNTMGATTVPIAGFPRPLLSIATQWRYNDQGTNLGTVWRDKLYNDSSWPSGLALFDAKRDTLFPSGYTNRITINGETVRTHITLSNATGTAQIPTVYFRTHFNYPASLGLGTRVLCFRTFVDDAAAIYVNGVEVLRTPRMPQTGPILYTTLAGNVGDANYEGPFYGCVTNLMAGDNVLAVEVHQDALTSSDITWGTEMTLLQATPPSSLTISQSAGGIVTLTWTGPAGSVLQQASPSVTGPWGNSPNQSQNQTLTLSGTSRFFRVLEP